MILVPIGIRFQELLGGQFEFDAGAVPAPHLTPVEDLGRDHLFLCQRRVFE